MAFSKIVADHDNDDVAFPVMGVASIFTEFLLRDIIQLTPAQQLELVSGLADGTLTKGKFKQQAENYQTRNDILAYCCALLGNVKPKYAAIYEQAVSTGSYDKEWRSVKQPTAASLPKLTALLESIRKQIRQEEQIQLIHGDFYAEIQRLGQESIDLVLTDPPFNVATERQFTFKDEQGKMKRAEVDQDFGEWDKFDPSEFIALFDTWASEFWRVMKPNSSGYVFCGYAYYSHLKEAFERVGFKVHTPLFWKKTNPVMQVIQRTFCNAGEQAMFFTKGTDYTFHWQGQNEMHNIIEFPICAGNERIKNAKGNTAHPTQKPESLIRHLMEISSNPGDMVFDGFMGVGTTPAVAKKIGRACIGIEQSEEFFTYAEHRIADISV